METKVDLREVLQFLPPQDLSYEQWLSVGMALHDGGYDCAVWEDWSRGDRDRYHPGECNRKWGSFHGSASPVTGGTIVQLAREYGWRPGVKDGPGYSLDWDSAIGSGQIVDIAWVEDMDIRPPETWDPAGELTRYLETLFDTSENVGYVTTSWERDGKHLPSKGSWDRTAGELIEALGHCGGDIGAVLGDYDPEAGAWIRFNPLDGKGCKNENVTDYRYALVESDVMDIGKQNAMIRELELPVACLVYSGGKSLHAIVRIEAGSYDEYRKRVDFLYGVLRKNGMAVDTQNKNPSRLSRMPGVTRGSRKQFLVDVNIGKESWREWQTYIEAAEDNLPDEEDDLAADLPELASPLIDGVLRQGHKMLIAGPSKAGKSFALIEMAICISEGIPWLGFPCTQGKVMYVNLELDRASCLHRFRDVRRAMHAPERNGVTIWNLRGYSVPMDALAPKLIRRAAKKHYTAIIIDPIYKVITGDENSADQMAAFCNQFDKVCTELGCAVIYCHHHSKGSQAGKRSMDRASGSGVFARDPDALLDLIELEVTDSVRKAETDRETITICQRYLNGNALHWEDSISQDDMCIAAKMLELSRERLCAEVYGKMLTEVKAAEKAVEARTAWRIEGTLREFPKFPPVNLWFDYPRHRMDESGVLQDLDADGAQPIWKKGAEKRRQSAREQKRSKAQEFAEAVENCCAGEAPTVNDLVEWYSGTGQRVAERTMRDWVKKFGFCIDRNSGKVVKCDE